MGRELKRVPLDFNWPLNMVWKGYISPYRSQECTVCGGSGYSPEAQRLGVPERCTACNGDGAIWFSERIKQLADAWYDDERYDPPAGEGWQVWETVTEGSPISPVFADADGVYRWLLQQGYSQPAALAFVDAQWAPSMVMVDGEVKDGIEALT